MLSRVLAEKQYIQNLKRFFFFGRESTCITFRARVRVRVDKHIYFVTRVSHCARPSCSKIISVSLEFFPKQIRTYMPQSSHKVTSDKNHGKGGTVRSQRKKAASRIARLRAVARGIYFPSRRERRIIRDVSDYISGYPSFGFVCRTNYNITHAHRAHQSIRPAAIFISARRMGRVGDRR